MLESSPDYRLLFESSPDVLLVLLPDAPRFTMVAATEARLRATHTTREQTIGRSLFEAFPDNPDDLDATGTRNLRASLERVLATRAADTMPVQRYDIRGPDGTFHSKYWSPINIPVLSNAGDVRYILHRVEDVTDLVRANEVGVALRDQTRAMEREVIKRSQEIAETNRELREANAKLGQLDAAKTAFFSNVSHEFRTPLTLILGPIEDAMAQKGGTLTSESLAAVQRSARRLLRLVNSLLDFSRIEAGRLPVSFEPTDLFELTVGLAESFRSLVENAGMSLVVDCSPISVPVYVDRSHWEKIILNLMSNAFKFTLAGEIAVRLRERDTDVDVMVSDTGSGIPEHEQARVFERFHRVESTIGRSFEGSGIGLALVNDLVKLHGGSVRVESVPGKGSTFTVSIPKGSSHLPPDKVAAPKSFVSHARASDLIVEASQWSSALDKTTSTSNQSTPDPAPDVRRILVVEDNPDMRAYIAGLLRPHWNIDVASDGEQALERIGTLIPDLVLSDVMMPRMDGITLLRTLRAAPRTRLVPVILLSARTAEEDALEGLVTGADDYLVKPFSARDLLARVRVHLDAAHARASALRASEMRFRRLAESGIVGIAVSDASGRVLEANDAFLQMLAFSRERLISGEIAWSRLSSDADPAFLGELSSVPGRPWEGELDRGDGGRLPVLVVVAALENNERLAIVLDLSERRRLEAQFRQAQKMEAVGRLAGGVAHDFNNVLSVVLSYAELIGAGLRPDEPFRADIDEIKTAAQRATHLTRQLLAFSRQQVLEPKIVSLSRVVDGMEKMLRRLLGADVALTMLLDASVWSIKADQGQLEQVLMNLVVNARDAMPQGGKLTIQTTNVELDDEYALVHHAVRPGQYVLLAVSDTGSGIDAETQAKIFEPFFTTKEKGKGTGLGLATVFGIVKQSGGHIWVYSEPQKGATFKVYFPRATGNTSRPPPVEVETNESPRGIETILLVEDDAQVRALARSVLRRNGYVVLEAANGGEALLLCEQHGARIDLLLTDVVLPLMGGRQIAERLKRTRREMKVLFMSGYTDDAILQHGVLDSGVAYLQKPLTPGSLARKVREVLDQGAGQER